MKAFKEFKEQDLHAMTLSRASISKSGINPVIRKDIPKLKKDLEDMRNRLAGKPPSGGTSK
jgi:hypothetical protein